MGQNQNRVFRINNINKLAEGFEKHCSKLGGLVIETGEKVSSKEILRAFEAVVTADADVASARGALDAALLDEQKTREASKAIVSAVRKYARLMFAAKPEILSDFGLAPTRRHVRDTEERAATLAKLRATRARSEQHPSPAAPAANGVAVTPNPIVPATNGAASNGGS